MNSTFTSGIDPRQAGPTSVSAASEVIREWLTFGLRTMKELSGGQEMIRALRPYCMNSGMAAAHLLISTFPADFGEGSDLSTIPIFVRNAFHADHSTSGEIREKGEYLKAANCRYRNEPSEICVLFCSIITYAMMQVRSPDHEQVLVKTMSQGDPYCAWVIKRRTDELAHSPEQLGTFKRHARGPSIDAGVVDNLTDQYISELWVIMIRAMGELYGNERTLEVLGPYMHSYGKGMAMVNEPVSKLDAVDSVTNDILSFNQMLNIEGEDAVRTGLSVTRNISNCPFKDAPGTVCSLMGEFYSGLAERNSPNTIVKCEREGGAGKCILTMEGSGATSRPIEENVPRADDEEPIRILKIRLARGEINIEEFERTRRMLV